MIVKHTVLILVLIKIALSYKQYKYHELCPGNKFKALFDTMTNNKPEVRLNDGDESAALIHYQSNPSKTKKIGRCEFKVKLEDPARFSGIFVSIKKLKLRENTYDGSCKDFIRFTYKNGTSTTEICGNIDTTVHNNLIRNFFDVTPDEFNVEISIATHLSDMDGYNGLEVFLVFTAYSSCNGSSTLRCNADKCISDIFKDDEILNCPPPGCLDESNCVNHEKPHIIPIKTTESSGGSSGSAHIIIPVVVAGMILIGILCFCKKKKSASDSQTSQGDHVEELRPTARPDLDSYLEFQDVRPIPMHSRPTPLVPEEEQHRGPMPSVPPDQRYDRPVPSAPPCGFKDDPPPYETLFTSDANKRTNV